MSTRKLTKSEREEVETIFKSQRSAGRCAIVRELRAEAAELTSKVDPKIKKLEMELAKLREEKTQILKDAQLIDFDPNGKYCRNVDLHPKLMAYDEETDGMLVRLLTEEKIPVDVKAVLTKALESEATA